MTPLNIEVEVSETEVYYYVNLKVTQGQEVRTTCTPFVKKYVEQHGWDVPALVSRAIQMFMRKEPPYDPETEEYIK